MFKSKILKVFYGLVTAWFICGLLPLQSLAETGPTAQAQNGAGPGRKVLVDSQDSALLAGLSGRGGVLLQDYGSFSLWRVSPQERLALVGRDDVTSRDEFDRILLRGRPLQTGVGVAPADVPAPLKQNLFESAGMRLVQFVGPVKEEWLNRLRQAGIQLVSYMPYNAYVVWGDAARLKLVQSLAKTDPVVQFVGPYHPAYRLAPALQAGAGGKGSQKQFDGPQKVTVQLYNTPDLQNSLAQLRSLGGKVYKEPAAVLNLVNISLEVPSAELVKIANWPDVFNVEPWSAPRKQDEAQGQIVAGNVANVGGKIVPTGPGYLDWLTSKGFPTDPFQYPVVDVVDDGIDDGSNAPLHRDFHVSGVRNPANPGPVTPGGSGSSRLVYNQKCTADAIDQSANGKYGHGNLNAAIVGGYDNRGDFPSVSPDNAFHRGLGLSPFGRVAGTRIFNNNDDFDLSKCADNDPGVVAASYAAGANITSNSWGSDVYGAYDASSQAYDALTRDASASTPGNQGMLHVFSAGNRGPNNITLGSPGTAKNVLAVGATEKVRDNGISDNCNLTGADNADDMASFSSRGPTADGRAKPDVVAPGVHIQAAASQDPLYNGQGVCGPKYYPAGQTLYTWSSGTSHAAPAASGAASLAYNYYQRVLRPGQTPSPAMLKALLLNSPRYLNGSDTGDTLPSPNQGWGDLNLGTLTDGTPRLLTDQTIALTATGQQFKSVGTVADSTRPVRVSLVWTDAPGSTTAASYVNDLDLEVTVGGQVFKGNVFQNALSVPGGLADSVNNVENVFLPAGTTGPIAVRVRATNLAGDGVPGNATPTDQDFALVVYNANPATTPVFSLSNLILNDAGIGGNNNGQADPGETLSLNLSLFNAGNAAATGLSATLNVNPAQATLLNVTSAYPNLAADASATNSIPFRIKVKQTLACGTSLVLSFVFSYGGGSTSFTLPLLLGTLAPPASYPSAEVPLVIPDGEITGVDSHVALSGGVAISKIKVHLDITHPWVGDLTVKLTSPANKTVVLAAHPGGTGNDGDNFSGTIFDDAAATKIDLALPPYNGTFRPFEPLSAFIGQPADGTWTLNVSDDTNLDAGTLNSWSLDVQTQTYLCSVVGSTLTVTSPTDTGNPAAAGSLSEALGKAVVGDVIQFNLTGGGKIIELSGTLPPVPDGVKVGTDANCTADGPGIYLRGNGGSVGLKVGKAVSLTGLWIGGFSNKQVDLPVAANLKLKCSRLTKAAPPGS